MIVRRRKTMALCHNCHVKLHAGKLDRYLESRIHREMYVRFGGECLEAYHSNVARRRVLTLLATAMASFAGQPSSSIGVAFLKTYAAICLEGCVIVLACVIFSAFASAPPVIADDTLAAATIVWNYVGETIFNLLVLVGAIKMSDRLIRERMGLG